MKIRKRSALKEAFLSCGKTNEQFESAVQVLVKRGYFEEHGDNIIVTDKGVLIVNGVWHW